MNIKVETDLPELKKRIEKAEDALKELNDYLERMKISDVRVIQTKP